MKTIKVILVVLAVILLALTAFFYFVDAPVVEEGQEPTVAQKIVLLGKQYLAEILVAFGVSGIGVIGVLVKFIYDSSKNTQTATEGASKEVKQLKAENAELKNKMVQLCAVIENIEQKQDILTNTILDTFSLSELPISLREQIHNAQTAYNAIGTAKNVAEQVVIAAANAPQEPIQQVSVFPAEEDKDGEKAEETVSPIYV